MSKLSKKLSGAALAGLMGAGMLASSGAQAGGEHMECGFRNTHDMGHFMEYRWDGRENDVDVVIDRECIHRYADHVACKGHHKTTTKASMDHGHTRH